jgi:hypothetical protein
VNVISGATLKTPLMMAVEARRIACVEVLLKAGARIVVTEADCDATRMRLASNLVCSCLLSQLHAY